MVVLVALAGAALLGGPQSSDPGRAAAASGSALRAWDVAGCWDLDVGPWKARSAGAGSAEALPVFLRPPSRVMLLPDSIDEWRRPMTTYRAAPLAGEGHELLDGHMRWFVRGDTLWLVWSDRAARAGVALRREGDGFSGAARASAPDDSFEGIARAAARRVNCSTFAPERGPVGPER